MLTAQQCRMARAALNIGVRELAAAADLSPNTIARLERGETLHRRTLAHVQGALEARGVALLTLQVAGSRAGHGFFPTFGVSQISTATHRRCLIPCSTYLRPTWTSSEM